MPKVSVRQLSVLAVILFVGFFVLNHFISREDKPEENPSSASNPMPSAAVKSPEAPANSSTAQSAFLVSPGETGNKTYAGKEVLERIHLDPNRTFEESVFWADGHEIGRFKAEGDKVYDVQEIIPDGQVKFVNETTGTQGEESFLNGKRDGERVEYYENGAVKKKTQYQAGKKISNKEYFIDGQLQLEENLEDALRFSETKDLGEGKAYYRTGVLMYEWNITNMGEERFSKSYNIKGQLVELKHYDEYGKVIKVEDFPPQDEDAPKKQHNSK